MSTPPSQVDTSPTALRSELSADLRTLRSLRPQLEEFDRDFAQLNKDGGWTKRGYFSVAENDRIAVLLFRFSAAHSALWKITATYQNMQAPLEEGALDAKAHVISSQASLLLASHSAFLVSEFAEDPIAISKLNEAFERVEIPRDSYYKLTTELTSKRLTRLAQAGHRAATELADPQSDLARLASADPTYSALIDLNAKLQTTAEQRVRTALEKQGPVEPEALRRSAESLQDGLYVARSVLFKDVSRLKSPTARLVRFSSAQKAAIHDLLRPGDVILTYTAGYASDVFIPGAFKHGITYVGSPAERAQAGLRSDGLSGVAPDAHDQLSAHVAQATLENGKPADMIEAVAEGVIFNDLDFIMDTHINRLLVLRPKLSQTERKDFLIEVFSYLGEEYDFRFDFADSTRQVCTEVIYRAIQGKGGIEFGLSVRAGHETLSADDVVLYFLNESPESFEFVLYAEEDPASSNHQARLLSGDDGVQRLRALMQSVGEESAS